MNPDRRQFLGLGLAAVGARARSRDPPVELVQARSPQEAASALQRWGLLIDITKCADCDECVTACHEENGVTGHGRPATDAQWIRKVSLRDKRTGFAQTLPLMCQHCEHPPCVDVCPTGASFKRDDGIVLVDKHTCIGCRYCVMACPYGARSFVHEARERPEGGRAARQGHGGVVHAVRAPRGPRRDPGLRRGVQPRRRQGHGVRRSERSPRPRSTGACTREPSSQIRADLALNTGVRYQGL